MSNSIDTRGTVRALLDAAGLSVLEHEFEALVSTYPGLRAGADSLYIEELRYEEPALTFTPVSPRKAEDG